MDTLRRRPALIPDICTLEIPLGHEAATSGDSTILRVHGCAGGVVVVVIMAGRNGRVEPAVEMEVGNSSNEEAGAGVGVGIGEQASRSTTWPCNAMVPLGAMVCIHMW